MIEQKRSSFSNNSVKKSKDTEKERDSWWRNQDKLSKRHSFSKQHSNVSSSQFNASKDVYLLWKTSTEQPWHHLLSYHFLGLTVASHSDPLSGQRSNEPPPQRHQCGKLSTELSKRLTRKGATSFIVTCGQPIYLNTIRVNKSSYCFFLFNWDQMLTILKFLIRFSWLATMKKLNSKTV